MGFGVSSVSTQEISQYTKSEQPRIAGKHLTRHAKNSYAIVCNIATGLHIFFKVDDRCRGRWIQEY